MIPGCIGKDETKVEKLRSILAQLEYAHSVNLLHSKGAHFKDHLYVPEVHPITGIEFCEREDEGHIFKVHACKNIRVYFHNIFIADWQQSQAGWTG